jgi:hypothetical protein
MGRRATGVSLALGCADLAGVLCRPATDLTIGDDRLINGSAAARLEPGRRSVELWADAEGTLE